MTFLCSLIVAVMKGCGVAAGAEEVASEADTWRRVERRDARGRQG